MPKFLSLTSDSAVNLDTITRVERMVDKTLVTMGSESIISDIPYDTILAILNSREKDKESFMDESGAGLLNGLQGLVDNFGQAKP